MKWKFLAIAVLVAAAAGYVGFRMWWSSLFPPVSQERIYLGEAQRRLLERLRKEKKFQPHDFPPLGYTGTESPDEEARAVRAVNHVIDTVLTSPGGVAEAPVVSAAIGEAMHTVEFLPTADRDRTAEYMVEIWYITGFHGATGQFVYGGTGPIGPPGFAEPLPPGWIAADRPRPIG